MTEEEFKKVMTKTIIFIVIALILLIFIGIFVFNKSGKSLSIFSNQEEIDNYKEKVEEVNSPIVNEEENLEEVEALSNENISDEVIQENNQIEYEGEAQAETSSEEEINQ